MLCAQIYTHISTRNKIFNLLTEYAAKFTTFEVSTGPGWGSLQGLDFDFMLWMQKENNFKTFSWNLRKHRYQTNIIQELTLRIKDLTANITFHRYTQNLELKVNTSNSGDPTFDQWVNICLKENHRVRIWDTLTVVLNFRNFS